MSTEPELSRTHVIRLVGRIGDHVPSISMAEVKIAVGPRVPFDDGLLLSLEPQDGTEALYQQAAEVITRKVPGFVEHRVATSEANHLSIFGFAPMPLLMLLGRTIGDKHPAQVYERHRHSDSWRWDEEGPPLEWTDAFPARPVRGRAVALLLSVTDTVGIDAVQRALGGEFDVVELGLPRPKRTTNIVRTRADLRGFAEQWRITLNRIKEEYGAGQIHLFPAAPLSVCVELGRRLLPKADPEIVVYDYFGGRFRRALSLRGPEVSAIGAFGAMTVDWRMGLRKLFATGFKRFELRGWVDGREDGISRFVGADRLSREEFADQVFERLEERGVINEAFFSLLSEHFEQPGRKAEVEAIRRAWIDARSSIR